jgi:hypothetical protein
MERHYSSLQFPLSQTDPGFVISSELQVTKYLNTLSLKDNANNVETDGK